MLAGWVGGVVLVVIFFFGLCGACTEEEEKSGTVFLSWVGRNREETEEEDFFQAAKEKGITQSHVLFRISSSKPDWLLNRQLEQEQLQVLSARAESGTYFILTCCCCCL